MKLFVVALTVALLASSASGSLFSKRKQAKVVDIHIEKGTQPGGGGVGQVPVGQIPLIGLPLGGGPLPIPLDQFIPQYGFPLRQSGLIQAGLGFQVGHIQVGTGVLGTKGGIPKPPGTKTPVGQIPPSYGGPAYGGLVHHGGQFNVPVLSQHSFQVVPVQLQAPLLSAPQLVSVEPSVQAVQLLFKSASSPLLVRQKHFGAHESTLYQATQSQDSPHVLRHEVLKPVLQEVREVIQPYRTVTQEIKPVLERVHTILPRGQYQGQNVYQGQQHHQGGHHGLISPAQQVQQRVHFQQPPPIQQQPIEQVPIEQEPIEQEPIQQEPIEQAPVKGHIV